MCGLDVVGAGGAYSEAFVGEHDLEYGFDPEFMLRIKSFATV